MNTTFETYPTVAYLTKYTAIVKVYNVSRPRRIVYVVKYSLSPGEKERFENMTESDLRNYIRTHEGQILRK